MAQLGNRPRTARSTVEEVRAGGAADPAGDAADLQPGQLGVVEGPRRRPLPQRVGGPVRRPAQEDRRGAPPDRHDRPQAGPAAAPDQLRLTRRSTHGGRHDHGAITTCPRPLPRPGAPSRPGPGGDRVSPRRRRPIRGRRRRRAPRARPGSVRGGRASRSARRGGARCRGGGRGRRRARTRGDPSIARSSSGSCEAARPRACPKAMPGRRWRTRARRSGPRSRRGGAAAAASVSVTKGCTMLPTRSCQRWQSSAGSPGETSRRTSRRHARLHRGERRAAAERRARARRGVADATMPVATGRRRRGSASCGPACAAMTCTSVIASASIQWATQRVAAHDAASTSRIGRVAAASSGPSVFAIIPTDHVPLSPGSVTNETES